MGEVYAAYWISSAILFSIWVLILINGIRSGLARSYPVFYACTIAAALALVAKLAGALSLGLAHPLYARLYFWVDIPMALLSVYLLWRINTVITARPKVFWIVVPVLFTFILENVLLKSTSLGEYQVNGAICCLFLTLCGAAYFRLIKSPNIVIGRNFSGILAGFSIPYGLIWSNHVAYLFGVPWWPFDFFGYSTEPAIIVGWLIMAWGMWRYDPPRRIEDESSGDGLD